MMHGREERRADEEMGGGGEVCSFLQNKSECVINGRKVKNERPRPP